MNGAILVGDTSGDVPLLVVFDYWLSIVVIVTRVVPLALLLVIVIVRH